MSEDAYVSTKVVINKEAVIDGDFYVNFAEAIFGENDCTLWMARVRNHYPLDALSGEHLIIEPDIMITMPHSFVQRLIKALAEASHKFEEHNAPK